MKSKKILQLLTLIMRMALVASAQSELRITQEKLRNIFQRKTLLLKVDMPADISGIDLYPQRTVVFDEAGNKLRLKKFGTSLLAGFRAVVTDIEVKERTVIVEFNGGGYGSAADIAARPRITRGRGYDADGMNGPQKSLLERSLEAELGNSKDEIRNREIKEQLTRERYQNSETIPVVTAETVAKHVSERRPMRGSRFNIRFNKTKNTATITPEELMRLLDDFVDFSPMTSGAASKAVPKN